MTHMNRKPHPTMVIVFLTFILLISGCTTRIADLTLISTKNIDLSNAALDMRKGQRVKGEDCKIALLGLIPLGTPNLEAAVDDALVKGNGNVMVDQVSYHKGIYFILASQSCIQVEGTVLNASTTQLINHIEKE